MWAYVLNLPSGFCLELDDCCYVPALSKEHCLCMLLDQKVFHLTFSNNCCSIMLNDVLYVGGTLSNVIYIFDMSNPI